jgi:hypothetical protein
LDGTRESLKAPPAPHSSTVRASLSPRIEKAVAAKIVSAESDEDKNKTNKKGEQKAESGTDDETDAWDAAGVALEPPPDLDKFGLLVADAEATLDPNVANTKAIGAAGRQARARLPGPGQLNQIAKLAYHALKMVIVGNKKSLPRVMDAMGVDAMVKHKMKQGIPAAFTEEWGPPIHTVLKTNIDAGSGIGGIGGATAVRAFSTATHIVNKTNILFFSRQVLRADARGSPPGRGTLRVFGVHLRTQRKQPGA